MRPASSRLLDESARFLRARRPGRALALLASLPVPVVATNWFAARVPAGDSRDHDASPLVDVVAPIPATASGALDGGTVVVKDAFDVAGLKTGLGLADGGEVATVDSEIVARVRAAGGIVVGKSKMTELGMDGLGALMHGAMPRNPRAPEYFPGGSSTGTAVAVASGLARYGIGADGLGSIRIPAALCGLVGLKTTRARLPATGFPSPAPSLDVAGPIARDVADCARLFQVLAGEPVTDVVARAPSEVGIVEELAPDLASRSLQRAFTRALAAIGARPRRISVPGANRCTFLGGMLGASEVARTGFASRASTPAGRMNVALGRSFSDRDVAALDAQRVALGAALARALASVPLLAMPTTAIPAPAFSPRLLAGDQDLVMMRALGAYTPLANLTGVPAIAVPAGVDDRGRPLSIMFLAPHGQERALFEVAMALEKTGVASLPV